MDLIEQQKKIICIQQNYVEYLNQKIIENQKIILELYKEVPKEDRTKDLQNLYEIVCKFYNELKIS